MQSARVGWSASEADRMEPEAVRYAKPQRRTMASMKAIIRWGAVP